MFKSKREKQLEELTSLYAKKISKLETELVKSSTQYVYVQVPAREHQFEYQKRIAEICDDKSFLFWFSQLQYSVLRDFEQDGKDNSEFYRGKLAMLKEIVDDSIKARDIVGGANVKI